MNSLHKSMHGKHGTQHSHGEEHSHAHHGHLPHGETEVYAQDPGIRLMGFLARLQHLDHYGSWMSNYRNTRFVPVSNSALAVAIVILVGGTALAYTLPGNLTWIGIIPALIAGAYLAVMLVGGLVFTLFLRHHRMEIRRTVLNSIPWNGSEKVLDVACGSGTLLLGVAQKLNSGKAVGIDIYQPNSGGGTLHMLMENARAEGVANYIEYQEMDARQLSFDDASFDVVVSSLALHHIGTNRAEIEQSISEMIRVLKPGGYIALVDLAPLIDLAEAHIRQSGLTPTLSTRNKYFRFVTVQKS